MIIVVLLIVFLDFVFFVVVWWLNFLSEEYFIFLVWDGLKKCKYVLCKSNVNFVEFCFVFLWKFVRNVYWNWIDLRVFGMNIYWNEF